MRLGRWGRDEEPPAPPPVPVDVGQVIFEGLSATRTKIAGRVPMEVLCEVGLIIEVVSPLLESARLTADGATAMGADARDILRRITTDYLPSALDSYLRLPRDYADTELLGDGRSAKDALLAQLNLLRERVQEAADASRRGDTDALLASQRFLDSRFGGSDGLTLQF